MKTKRAVLSMIVIISVFCLSVVFDMQSHINTAKESVPEAATPPAAKRTASTNYSNGTTKEPLEASIQSFAHNINTVPLLPPAIGTIPNDISGTSVNDELPSPDNNRLPDTKDTISTLAETSAQIDSEDTITDESTEAESKVPEKEDALYSDMGISIAESYVNIRESASTESGILGKLYRNSAAQILSEKGEWYYVESGSVTGYVKTEFIKTKIPDDEIIEKYGVLNVVVKVDGLNVREKPDTESDKVTVIYRNESYPVIELEEDWIKVDITDDKEIGYIKREFAELIVDFEDAVSKEEELELKKLQEEERIKKETEVKYQDEVNYSKEDLKLLACLVHAEAGGQSYEGKLAVANIVLNRVKSRKYPDTMKAVIYQSGQFSVAKSGSLDKQLSNYGNYDTNSQRLTIKAARAALEGANNIGSRLYFHSYKSALKKGYDHKNNSVKIGDHLFW